MVINPVEKIGLKWAKRISLSFIEWAKQEQKSRTIEIKPFDPSPLIEGAFYAAGEQQLTEVGKLIGMGVKFDLRSKEAEKWISQFSADQIKYIDAANKQAIRQIKLRAQQEGLSLVEQRKLIKQHIGLLPNHFVAVQNYKDDLLKSGMDSATVDRLGQKYANKLLTYRANMIGVTEGMTAANEGTRQTNISAVERGVIDPNEYEQQWIVSGLPRTCGDCQAANGSRAPIGGTFPNGSRGPPLHPHDRCGTVLVRKTGYKAPEKEIIIEFTPAKNIKEAEEFARNNLLNPAEIDRVEKWNAGENHQQIKMLSYRGLDVDIANDINKRLYENQQIGLPKLNKILSTPLKKQTWLARASSSELEINSTRMGSYKKIKEELESHDKLYGEYGRDLLRRIESSGAALTGKQQLAVSTLKTHLKYSREVAASANEKQMITATIDHETAHILASRGKHTLDEATNEAFWKDLAKTEKTVRDSEYRYKLSYYGGEARQSEETFAESFAAYRAGERDSLHPDMINFIKKYFLR